LVPISISIVSLYTQELLDYLPEKLRFEPAPAPGLPFFPKPDGGVLSENPGKGLFEKKWE
jgi:hypothetical protein